MKGWRIFLAYYTLVVSLALFIWSLFFAQKPQGFLLTLLVVPIGFYFWLLVAGFGRHSLDSSESQSEQKYARYPFLVLATVFISSFSIFFYSLINSRVSSSESASLSRISQQIDSLKKELADQNKELEAKIIEKTQDLQSSIAKIESAQKTAGDKNVLDATTALEVGTVTIKDEKNKKINVYKDKSLSSEIIGKAEFGKMYTFIEKDQNWYLILFNDKQGYIQSELVKEVKY
jgi:hypothetical protein